MAQPNDTHLMSKITSATKWRLVGEDMSTVLPKDEKKVKRTSNERERERARARTHSLVEKS